MKYLKILALFMLLATPAWAQTKISQMPAGNALQATDTFPIIRGGVNYGANIALGSSTTAGILSCGGTTSCVNGVINAAQYPSQTGNAYEYLYTDGSNVHWGNPAYLIDPRTYGASCVGPGFSGSLTSNTAGIFVTNAGTGGTTGTYTAVPVTGGHGSGAIFDTVVVAGGKVTSLTLTTTLGTGYTLRDQISAASANIGNTTGFLAQVAHFNADESPVYDGVHDDTAAFQTALNLAQNTGQAVLVPNGCWITTLYDPQGVSMVGTGYSPTYDYNSNGGAAQNSPVLYEEAADTPMIVMGSANNNGFFGFELNDATSVAYQTGTCLEPSGTTGGSTGNHTYLRGMSFIGCYIAAGNTNNTSDWFPISIGNFFGAGIYGIYGKVDDWQSSNDTYTGNTAEAISAFGGDWNINGDRFEYNGGGIFYSGFGTNINNSQFDTNGNYAIYLNDGAGNINIVGDYFEGNGCGTGGGACGSTGGNTPGNDAAIVLGRNNDNQSLYPSGLNISGDTFYAHGSGGDQPYAIDVVTTGTDNDYTSVVGGNALQSSTTAFIVYHNGQPPHQRFNIPGVAAYDTISTSLTATGCSISATNASARAGALTSGTSGTCTFVVTPDGTNSTPQPHGWSCGQFLDQTTTTNTASWQQLGTTTTTATISGTTASSDVVSFSCNPY